MISTLLALSLSAFAAIPSITPEVPAAIIKPDGAVTATYELSLNYSILDQHFGVPSYVISEGEGASLVKESGGKKYYLDILAVNEPSDNKAGVLRMVFLGGVLNPNGSKTEVSRSALVARLGKTSRLSVASDEGKSEMSIAVVARKKLAK